MEERITDSLSFTYGLAVALAIVFLVITAGITVFKWFDGIIAMPRLLPDITDINSIWKLFTVVPVLVTAYICHFNGIDLSQIDNCIGDPTADEDNPVLVVEQEAQVGKGSRGDVTILPTLLINNRQYKGKLERDAVPVGHLFRFRGDD